MTEFKRRPPVDMNEINGFGADGGWEWFPPERADEPPSHNNMAVQIRCPIGARECGFMILLSQDGEWREFPEFTEGKVRVQSCRARRRGTGLVDLEVDCLSWQSRQLPVAPKEDGYELFLRFVMPRERYDAECAQQGHSWRRVVDEVVALCRNELKHNGELSASEKAVYHKVWDLIIEEMRDWKLSLGD